MTKIDVNKITDREKLTIAKGLLDYKYIMDNRPKNDKDFWEVPIYDSKVREYLTSVENLNLWWEKGANGVPKGTPETDKIKHDWKLISVFKAGLRTCLFHVRFFPHSTCYIYIIRIEGRNYEES